MNDKEKGHVLQKKVQQKFQERSGASHSMVIVCDELTDSAIIFFNDTVCNVRHLILPEVSTKKILDLELRGSKFAGKVTNF